MSAGQERTVSGGRETVEDRARARTAAPRHVLVVLSGKVQSDRRCVVLGTEPVQLGREVDPGHHIQLDDPLASRCHAELFWSEVQRRHWIRDLESLNGVYLNAAQVSRSVLARGDVLRIGNTVFRFTVETDAPEDGALEPPFVGRSRSLRRSLDLAARLATVDAPLLILGPTGTGKELLASLIHRASRRTGPLVPVNCAALPVALAESELFGHQKGAFSGADVSRSGLFRAAETGTLFLDEIGELTPELQAKLLRVLDARTLRPIGATIEAPIDVRVVAATNRDLAAEVSSGRFRADLYARLNESVVHLEALHDRPDDLEPLWRHFVAQLGRRATIGLSGAAFEAMALHTWPFNVRELRKLVRDALLLMPNGGTLDIDDLPETLRPPPRDAAELVDEPASAPAAVLADGQVPTAQQLRRLIEEFRGNVKSLAAFLGKDRKQIYRWLRRAHIDPDTYRQGSDGP